MKAAWTRCRTRYLALARRERALMMAAGLTLILGLGVLLLIEPAFKQRALLERQMQQQRTDLAALRPQVAALQARQRDPDAATLAQLRALREQLQLTDGEFVRLQRALVQPQEMGRLMESLLQAHRGLQLVGLRNVPVMSVSDLLGAPKPGASATATAPASAPAGASAPAQPAAAKDKEARDWLYRHGVEITVQGSYADMQAYLAALESLPRRVYWGELRIDAQNWPTNLMTVTVYTIGLEKTWWRV
jgi:MSHA biogenesis protein MshJ